MRLGVPASAIASLRRGDSGGSFAGPPEGGTPSGSPGINVDSSSGASASNPPRNRQPGHSPWGVKALRGAPQRSHVGLLGIPGRSLWRFRRRVRGFRQFFAPLGGLLGFAPGVVELHEAFGGFSKDPSAPA